MATPKIVEGKSYKVNNSGIEFRLNSITKEISYIDTNAVSSSTVQPKIVILEQLLNAIVKGRYKQIYRGR